MFGYIQANLSELSQEEKERYRAVYCGVCHTLGKRYGFFARLGLNYDLTFLALLLSSLYEPEEQVRQKRCIVHPFKKHTYISNSYIEYAADMTVALVYFKCLDDWNDEHKLVKRIYAALLSRSYRKVKAARPEQCDLIEKELRAISSIEERRDPSPDAAANHFGRLMADIFVERPDHWTPYLERFGYSLGKYIYLADAAVDLEDDRKTGSYNPLAGLTIETEDMRSMLKVILGEASEEFEMLPLIQDVNLMRNILYSGLWIKFNSETQKERGKAEDGE